MNLAHAGLLLGLATATRMAANLVTVKVLAVELGTTGMGYLGQFMSVMALAVSAAGGGVALGVTKYVAEHDARGAAPVAHARAGATIWLASSAAFLLALLAGASSLSQWLFGTPDYAMVFRGLAVVQFALGATNLLGAVLNGRHDVRGLAGANTLGALLGAALTCALAVAAGLPGAMWGLMLAPCMALGFAAWRVRRKGHLRGVWRGTPAPGRPYRDLLSFSGMLAVTAIAMPAAQIVLRTWQGAALGWDQAGLWQGLVKLSDAWLQFAAVILASYYYPRLARMPDHAALHREVRNTAWLFAAVLVPAAALIWLLRAPLVALLFSREFLPMEDLLAPQLAGDVLRMLAYVPGYVAVAKARAGLYIAGELFQAGMLLLLASFLLPLFGARGVPYAYCATYALYCAICMAAYASYHRAQAQGTR